jgi:putative molybdenum carrier protein
VALTKIVSGGQTGVDRGALDAALVGAFPAEGGVRRAASLKTEKLPNAIHSRRCRMSTGASRRSERRATSQNNTGHGL